MYAEFSVLTIEPILKDRRIIITTNMDIDANNINNIVVELYERYSKTPALFDYEVKNKLLIINLKSWPVPNSEYILGVKGIVSVTGDELSSSIKKRLAFSSEVISKVKILSPSLFEEIDDLNIELEEIADKEEDLTNNYYIEVATDNAFINNVITTTTNKKSIKLALKDNGQFFMRVRAQKDIPTLQYGHWSDIMSFIYKGITISCPDQEPDYIPDIDIDDEPEIEIAEDLMIVNSPDQGCTPTDGFIFEFNVDIDELSLDDIVIIRKDVR